MSLYRSVLLTGIMCLSFAVVTGCASEISPSAVPTVLQAANAGSSNQTAVLAPTRTPMQNLPQGEASTDSHAVPTMSLTHVPERGLASDEVGVFLVVDGEPTQLVPGSRGICYIGLPLTLDHTPVLLVRSDTISLEDVDLRRMLGGFGFQYRGSDAGCLVTDVAASSSADRAGIHEEDLIVSVDGQTCTASSLRGPIWSISSLQIQRGTRLITVSLQRSYMTGSFMVEGTEIRYWDWEFIPIDYQVFPEGYARVVPAVPLAEGDYCFTGDGITCFTVTNSASSWVSDREAELDDSSCRSLCVERCSQ